MAKLSKEQIGELEAELSLPWGIVNLQCDDHQVQLAVRQVKALDFRIRIFVNGVFNQSWCDPRNQAAETKYLRPSTRQLYTAKERQRIQKDCGKRFATKHCSGTYTVHMPYWASGSAALKHLCKVADSIQIVGVGRAALDGLKSKDEGETSAAEATA